MVAASTVKAVLSAFIFYFILQETRGLYPYETESREVKDLGGIWQFRADNSTNKEEGFLKKWFLKPLRQTGSVIPMPVPSSYNDITQDISLRDFVGWVWYEKEVFLPLHWKDPAKRVIIRFESVHHVGIVWVNGEQQVLHVGGHLPFEAEISSILNYEKLNRITVAVNNTLTPETIPPGEIVFPENKEEYPKGYFTQNLQMDFFNYAGIHRAVKLYTTPLVYISDITIVTDIISSIGAIEYKVDVTGSGNAITMTYQVYSRRGRSVTNITEINNFKGVLQVPDPKLWWPRGMSKTPGYLYTLKITASTSKTKDVYSLRVGIRTVRVRENSFLINETPFYFKGMGKHEDYEIRGRGHDDVTMVKDFNLLAWLGANSFRTSHYPYAEEILDMADKEGIVVIDESPAVGLLTEANFGYPTLEQHVRTMKELIDRDKNHPSVVLWSVANEPQTNMLKSKNYFWYVISKTRQQDPSRPVTFVTHMFPPKDVAVPFVDVICANRYYAWYHDSGHTELIEQQLETELRKWYDNFKKPIIQTEYGADAVAGLHRDPPAMFTEEYQADSIKKYFKVFDKLRKEFLVGEMVWNFADFMTAQGATRVDGNKKGVFTRSREPKMAAFVVRNRYHKLQNSTDRIIQDQLLDTLLDL